MQDDDTSNPATLSVLDGEALWKQKTGRADKACADCHGDAAVSMRGVSARYPAFSPQQGRPIDIEQRINLCRTGQQKAAPFAYESRDLLALTAFLGQQSRGMPIAIANDEKTKPFIEAGRKLYSTRQGQLNLSCQNCHDDNCGPEARRRAAGAGPPDRLPALPARMAERRLAAAQAAQLPDRHAGGALCLRRAGICRRSSSS